MKKNGRNDVELTQAELDAVEAMMSGEDYDPFPYIFSINGDEEPEIRCATPAHAYDLYLHAIDGEESSEERVDETQETAASEAKAIAAATELRDRLSKTDRKALDIIAEGPLLRDALTKRLGVERHMTGMIAKMRSCLADVKGVKYEHLIKKDGTRKWAPGPMLKRVLVHLDRS